MIAFTATYRYYYIGNDEKGAVLGFFFFNGGGMFIWIIPFILIGLLIRVVYHRTRPKRLDEYDPEEGSYPGRVEAPEKKHKEEAIESRIFKLANRLKGRITLSDIVLETGLGMKSAERVIEDMLDNLHVTMEVDDSGMVFYEFPEIIARYDREQSGT